MTPIVVQLKKYRLAKGLSQRELAASAHVRPATISDIERGKGRRVDLDVLERLANVLGVRRASDLLADD